MAARAAAADDARVRAPRPARRAAGAAVADTSEAQRDLCAVGLPGLEDAAAAGAAAGLGDGGRGGAGDVRDGRRPAGHGDADGEQRGRGVGRDQGGDDGTLIRDRGRAVVPGSAGAGPVPRATVHALGGRAPEPDELAGERGGPERVAEGFAEVPEGRGAASGPAHVADAERGAGVLDLVEHVCVSAVCGSRQGDANAASGQALRSSCT